MTPAAVRTVAGVNAGVVRLLAAALYDPLWLAAVRAPVDIAIAATGLAALQFARLSPLWVVCWCVLASVGWFALAG